MKKLLLSAAFILVGALSQEAYSSYFCTKNQDDCINQCVQGNRGKRTGLDSICAMSQIDKQKCRLSGASYSCGCMPNCAP
jgi:hypothetical protein